MTRRRKLLFGFVTMVLVAVALEGAARAYSALRYGNPVAIAYGWNFIGRLIDGTATLESGWGGGRGGVDEARQREAAEGVATQQLFDRRDDKNDGLTPREPRVVTFNSGIPAQLNSLNFRGPEIAPDGPPGVARIGAFGGSDVFGAYLKDDQTWEFLLQQRLNQRGVAAEVINAGNSGANIHGVIEDLIRVTNRARLDIAIVMNGYNNHPLLPIERDYTLSRRADFYLYNFSLFYVTAKEKLAKLVSQPLDYGLYRQRVNVRLEDVEWLVAIYRKRLDQIATVCAERKVRLVLATQPEMFFQSDLNEQTTQTVAKIDGLTARIRDTGQLSIAELEYYLQGRLNLALRDVAAARSVLVFDGELVLFADKPRHFVDQIHPNELGAMKLAAALEEFLTPVLRTLPSAP
jgi:lysophospholipase L1-like esterase